jgi:hypothetical protein
MPNEALLPPVEEPTAEECRKVLAWLLRVRAVQDWGTEWPAFAATNALMTQIAALEGKSIGEVGNEFRGVA